MTHERPHKSRQAPVIGLLGAVASGKSTVAALLTRHGAAVVDADRIGHEVLEEPEIRDQVREAFGEDVFGPDGSVERKKLGERVFGDREQLERLNAIIHPRLFASAVERVRREQRRPEVPMVVLDAALLLEKGLESCCDVLVFVESGDAHRRQRALRERGWTSADLDLRDAAQMSAQKKRECANYVIHNDGSHKQLENRVAKLVERIGQGFPIPLQ